MKEFPAAEVIVVGVHIDGVQSLHRQLLAFAQNHAQCLDDRLRDVLLNGEDISHLAIVLLRPEVIAVGDVDQLRGDANLVADLAYTALENRRDLELAADLADVFALGLERERRCA